MLTHLWLVIDTHGLICSTAEPWLSPIFISFRLLCMMQKSRLQFYLLICDSCTRPCLKRQYINYIPIHQSSEDSKCWRYNFKKPLQQNIQHRIQPSHKQILKCYIFCASTQSLLDFYQEIPHPQAKRSVNQKLISASCTQEFWHSLLLLLLLLYNHVTFLSHPQTQSPFTVEKGPDLEMNQKLFIRL